MKAPSLADRCIKVRAYLTDEVFGYEHWRATQFCSPRDAKPALLLIFETEAERETFQPAGVPQTTTSTDESHGLDGDRLGTTGPNTAADSALCGEFPMQHGAAKSSGATTAAKAERNSPKAGDGSNPSDSLSIQPVGVPAHDLQSQEQDHERNVRRGILDCGRTLASSETAREQTGLHQGRGSNDGHVVGPQNKESADAGHKQNCSALQAIADMRANGEGRDAALASEEWSEKLATRRPADLPEKTEVASGSDAAPCEHVRRVSIGWNDTRGQVDCTKCGAILVPADGKQR